MNGKQGTVHTFKKIGGKDFHYIDGQLAFIDGRPQPGFAGDESNWRRVENDKTS